MPNNTLYCADNLDILRRYVADESVDLVYPAALEGAAHRRGEAMR